MEENINENKVVSKKFMIFTASILTLLGICYGFVYFSFFNNNSTNDEKNEEKKCIAYFEKVLETEYELTDTYEVEKKKASEFYNNFDFDKLIEVDSMINDYEYSLEVCDLKIYYTDSSNSVYYNDKYYMLGDNDEYVWDFTNDILAEMDDVGFYVLKPEAFGYALSDEEYNLIRNAVDNLDYSERNIDLYIDGKYLIIVDDKKIYLDDFNGYAMYNGEVVKLNEEVLNMLSRYTGIKDDECCSCCPDLKPGESCIALCCPCGNN